MRTIRRHPLSVLIALAAGLILGAIAASGDWSNAALYGSALVMISVLVPTVLALDRGSPRRSRRH
jgi:hypothetical protein